MQSLNNIQKLLKAIDIPDSIADQLQAEITQLKKQLKQDKFIINRLQKDKNITVNFLNKTIQELEKNELQLQVYQEKELEKREQKIKNQEVQLKQITDAMPFSMSYVDRNYCYQINNMRYKKWFKLDAKALKNKHVEVVLGKDFFYEKVKPILDQVFEGKEIEYEIEQEVGYQNQKRYFKATYVPAYNEEGENIGAYIFGEDISLLRLQQKELTEKNEVLQKYIESNLQLENFARLASHDLKEPLLNIFGFTDLLIDEYNDSLGESGRVYLSYIRKSSIYMESLINDLLNYATIGKFSKIETISLHKLVDNVLTEFHASIERKKANILILNELPEIIGHQAELRSLFQNLISNAFKYQKSDVALQLSINSDESNKDYWHFSISDNGIGIAPEHHEQVFVIYKRLDNRQGQERSTGIGLAYCKKVVELHNGKIWIESQPNIGSTFHFTISKHLEPQ